MSKKINIAIVQTSINWEDAQRNLNKYDNIINSINPEVDIIFFPEMFNTGFSMNVTKISETMDGNSVSWLRQVALTRNVSVVASLAIEENKNFYNRLVWVFSNGEITFYDKRHTFTLAGESKVYTKGKAKRIIEYKGWKFLPQICYDLRFPGMYKMMSKRGAIFISIPSAFTETTGRKHWHTLLKARAIENFSYVFAPGQAGKHCNGRKTYGHSMIVSPDGKILKELGKREGIITAAIDPKKPFKLRKTIPSVYKD